MKKHIFSLDEEMGFSRFEKVMAHIGQALNVNFQGGTEKNGCGASFSLEGLFSFIEPRTLKTTPHPQRDDSLVLRCFEILHCEAGIPHHVLAHFPTALTGNPLEVIFSWIHILKTNILLVVINSYRLQSVTNF